MKKHLLILILIFCSAMHYGFAQVTFQKGIGNGTISYANSVQQTTDMGYIVAGTTWTPEPTIYLIKTDSTGDLLWTKIIGGTGRIEGVSVQKTNDGGYIVMAATIYANLPGHANYKGLYLIKTNAVGDTLWTKAFSEFNNFHYYGNSIQQTSDHEYIIAGASTDSMGVALNGILINTDQVGNINWLKAYTSQNNAEFFSVHQTTDSGYIAVGYSKYPGVDSAKVYLVKTNSVGDTLWTKAYGGADNDIGYSVKQTSDGGYIIAGSTSSFGAGASDVYLIKTDSVGNALWSKTFGGFDADIGYDVQQTTDGGYIVSGSTYSFGNNSAYLIKTDSLGSPEWSKAIVGSNTHSVDQTVDGGYVTAGTTLISGKVDFLLVKTDNLGNAGCNEIDPATIIGPPATQTSATATQISNVTFPNTRWYPSIVWDGGSDTTLCTTVDINETQTTASVIIFPNPATNNLTIETPQKATIVIINIQGQIIKTIEASDDKTRVDVSAFAGGVHIIKLITSEGSVVRKFIKQ